MIGLFFGGQAFRASFGNEFGNIELDATLEETHEWTARATSNPVETGAPITDHVIDEPDKLTLRGFITDSPLHTSANLSGVFNEGPTETRTQPFFDFLYQLIKLREPVLVYTKHKLYRDMVLTTVTIPRTPTTGEALEFVAEFINIRKVATQTVDVPKGISQSKSAKGSAAVGRKTEPKKDAGKKQTEEVSDSKSILRSTLENLQELVQ